MRQFHNNYNNRGSSAVISAISELTLRVEMNALKFNRVCLTFMQIASAVN